MISLLDIIGPVMIGPSSSHTAGACRIGLVARQLLGDPPRSAKVELHGSFARTGAGHGTDRAIAGGLLGLHPDDERLRESLDLARESGLDITFVKTRLRGIHHPNTARITLAGGAAGVAVTGSSLGAGRIRITGIDGFPVEISGEYPTLVFVAHDEPGMIATASGILARGRDNIAALRVYRRRKGGDAIHVYELDTPPSRSAVESIRELPTVRMVRVLERIP